MSKLTKGDWVEVTTRGHALEGCPAFVTWASATAVGLHVGHPTHNTYGRAKPGDLKPIKVTDYVVLNRAGVKRWHFTEATPPHQAVEMFYAHHRYGQPRAIPAGYEGHKYPLDTERD